MSNPYRARPGRSRVDSSPNYGMHNQNSWNVMAQPQPPSTPDQNQVYMQNPAASQRKQSQDASWEWGTDSLNNGNDSWNWNLDQQSEAQQPQPAQQSAPYRPYPPQNQPQSLPVYPQENYYKNVNGNNRFAPTSAPSVSNSEPYHQFPTYNYDQQHQPQFPPRPPSAKPLQREPPPTTPKPQDHSFPQANTNYNWSSPEPVPQVQQQPIQQIQQPPVQQMQQPVQQPPIQPPIHPPTNLQNHWQDQNTNKQVWVRQPQQVNEAVDYKHQWAEQQDPFSQSRSQNFTQNLQSWHQPQENWSQQDVPWNQESAFPSDESRKQPTPSSSTLETPKYPKEAPSDPIRASGTPGQMAQDNLEADWNTDAEWDTVTSAEVATSLAQLTLNDPKVRDAKSRVVPGSKVEQEQPPENVPVPKPEEKESRNLEATSGGNLENSGYDQWYNRWGAQKPESAQWSAEANIENCENIQQPSEFVNLEVVALESQERDIYGSRDSINRETLDNDAKDSPADFRQEQSNLEVVAPNLQVAPVAPNVQLAPNLQNVQLAPNLQNVQLAPNVQVEQVPENYEFASNDRNTFLETGELTDSHQEHEPTPPSQDDENDEVPNDIPFLREVPGQSSSGDRRNDPTGQEHYVQVGGRIGRNDPSGQELLQRTLSTERGERRDVPSGQERNVPLQRNEPESMERRNIPPGRERHLSQPSRSNPSRDERNMVQVQSMLEPSEAREVPGRGNEVEDPDSGVRQILGGASPNETPPVPDERSSARVVTGSQEVLSGSLPLNAMQDPSPDAMNVREEAVGASVGENRDLQGPSNHRDSYEDGDDEGSDNSRDGSREQRRDPSPDRRRYDYDRRAYYDRDGYESDYYYRRGDYDRSFNSREDLDRHSRDDERNRARVDDMEDGRRRVDDRRGGRDVNRPEDLRRRDRDRDRDRGDYDMRYPRERDRDRDYVERDRRRDDRRPRRFDDYGEPYRRDYYDDYSRSSRPSSRSSYNDRDREFYMRSRDPYFYNGYGYDYNFYAYCENLRRTNPTAYAEWYNKYYATQNSQANVRAASNYTEDRASVHSGQSSCDDRSASDRRNLADISGLEDQTVATSSRLTPTKFSTSHVKGSFSVGSLLHVYPSYPTDGERARIDIFRVDNVLLQDALTRELKTYPGPLIKQVGVTHKKTIIEYCEAKIKKAASNDDLVDQASYILLYEFMIMLIQQNGNVVGVDIATLLLKNKEAYPYELCKERRYSSRRESTISQRSAASGGEGNVLETSLHEKVDVKPRKSIDEITDEFRRTLLYGLVQEALEYAMDEGLWGHALFLASKLDKRTHASVMTRFANSLPNQDPLQTLYQLHSGRVPASVTCIADRKWDDWRPHLAMIISNTSANPEINRRSITILGDTLAARGDIHAAHFCYILAQVDFDSYEAKDAKLVLIGANHHKPYGEFASTEAIMLTEIYEYARNLSEPGFALVNLQTFKFSMALKMADHGMLEKALLYIEQVAVNIAKEPARYSREFIKGVYELGDRIKYHDPVCKDSLEDAANLSWLNNLAEVVSKCQTGEIVQENTYQPNEQKPYSETDVPPQQPMWNVGQTEYQDGPASLMDAPVDPQNNWRQMSLPSATEQYDQSAHYQPQTQPDQNQYHQDYWQNSQNYNNSAAPQVQDYSQNDWQQQQQQQQQHNNQGYGTGQPDNETNQQQPSWDYESEREEKSSTPEVSSPPLDSCSPLSFASPPSSLRRRKPAPPAKPSPKFAKYPRVSSAYPPLAPSVRPPRKLVPQLTRPPSAQPPVFLKCKPKSATPAPPRGRDAGATSGDDSAAPRRNRGSLGASGSSSDGERPEPSQTLRQYCNFEEKKVVKVAPHIRRKDVICDTVDAWSREGDGLDAPRYKPLVFGGTYPIDLPLEGDGGQ